MFLLVGCQRRPCSRGLLANTAKQVPTAGFRFIYEDLQFAKTNIFVGLVTGSKLSSAETPLLAMIWWEQEIHKFAKANYNKKDISKLPFYKFQIW